MPTTLVFLIGKKCVDAIHSGMNKLQGYLKDHRKWKSVDERFRLELMTRLLCFILYKNI